MVESFKERRVRPILKNQNYWTPLLGALFFFMIGSGASLAVAFTDNNAAPDEAAIPFVMTSAAAVVILVGGFVINGVKEQVERAAIARVTTNAWVKWQQYESAADWRAFAEEAYRMEMTKRRYPWLGFIVIVVVFTGVTGWTFYLASADGANQLLVALPLGAFFAFVLLLMLGTVTAARRKIHATYHRRLRSPIPHVYISRAGLYSEDSGYRGYSGLANVYYQEGFPARLNFQFSVAVGYGFYSETVTVYVPRGQETDADRLAHRFFDEGIVRR
jgi:hypothetical protein